MKLMGKAFCIVGAAALTAGSPIVGHAQVITNVFETWESQATGPFTGAGDVTWVGDTAPFRIATEAWPSAPAQDFAGTKSIRHTNAVASTSTILTSFSLDSDSPTLWQVFVSGNSADVTSGLGFDLILMSDSSNAADVEAGNVNGYRLRLAGTTDSLFFQEANGGGVWTTLSSLPFGFGANINTGWNILVYRETGGTWTYGYTTGTIGSAVARVNPTSDTTVTSSSFAGMSWFSPASDAGDFGFDNFLIVTIPEPTSAALFLGSLGLCFLRQRKATRS